jgi:hypothetical protein
VSLGIAAGMVEDIEPESSGIRKAMPSRRTVPTVTTVFATSTSPDVAKDQQAPKAGRAEVPGRWQTRFATMVSERV